MIELTARAPQNQHSDLSVAGLAIHHGAGIAACTNTPSNSRITKPAGGRANDRGGEDAVASRRSATAIFRETTIGSAGDRFP
jgi:hypothetical protein